MTDCNLDDDVMFRDNLTVKQARFVRIWYETGNKSEAYRQAYNAENMSEASINNEAYKLSQNPEITLRYKELQKQAQIRSDITKDKLIAEYAIIGFADMSRFLPQLDDKGEKSFKHLTADERKVLGISVKDKLQALIVLAKYLGLYEADNEQLAGSTRSLEEREAQHQRLMAERRVIEANRGERIEREIRENSKNC